MSILTQLYEYLNNFDLIFSSYKVTKLRLKMREISWTNQRWILARFQPMRSLADTTPFFITPPRPSLFGLILSPEVQNSNSTKNGYFEVSFGFQNISNGFLDLNKSQLRKIYLFPMVSKSPLRNPLEMFWKPKESSNCGKVCKNEEKMETFTNIASRMTVDPKILLILY